MNDRWYNSIRLEVVARDCYAFKDWQPSDPSSVCIVDVGANAGAFSVMAAEAFPNAEVFSFELVKENYDFAVSKLREHKNVKIFNKAMVGSNTPVGLFQHSSNPGGHKPIFDKDTETYLSSDRFALDYSKTSVDCISFVEFLGENSIDKVDFLKLDCEGSEYEILFHVDEHGLWDKIERISMELHGRGDQEQVDRLMKMLNDNYSKVTVRGTNMVDCER